MRCLCPLHGVWSRARVPWFDASCLRVLARALFACFACFELIHGCRLDHRSASEKLASVTAVTDIDEFVSAAEVTGRSFAAEQHETVMLGEDGTVIGSDGIAASP